ncbi:hypothetical protein KP509_17G004500 [Ceratopteris richardii]|uniref:Intradiol ring-cleavage dioxygenases domain-containing protein n=1 Tax=Ceratopteris richardii TaxID=49495 RepID=A0A8T2SWG2_CERRI|nr:hypothetical protein KP509_17G004500 [Ceratopteris richardii]
MQFIHKGIVACTSDFILVVVLFHFILQAFAKMRSSVIQKRPFEAVGISSLRMQRLALVCIFFLSIGRVVNTRTAPFNGERQLLQSPPSPLSAPSSNARLPPFFHTPSSSSPSYPYFPSSALNCTQLAGLTQGPFWIEENIEASNMRLNLTYGVPLNITLKVANGRLSNEAGYCVPIEGARIDLWHARYDGKYSDVQEEKTLGETWLRGYLLTNSTGHATFYTIFPGWYITRTVHIHVRIRTYQEDGNTAYEDTTQLFFDDTISTAILADVYPYNSRGPHARDTYNDGDRFFKESNMISLEGSFTSSDGYSTSVEMILPLKQSKSLPHNGESSERDDGVSYGIACIR